MISLTSIPAEILEHIAFFSSTQNAVGPPSSLLIFLTLNRKINIMLSPESTPHLYARIFGAKFDIAAPLRRLGSSALTASSLTNELQTRCIVLKRIRAGLDCLVKPGDDSDGKLDSVLWTAYLMMLENDGKNAIQLRDYANVGDWLSKYWFDDQGASLAVEALESGTWPMNDTRAALAMWLFWFFFDPGKYAKDDVLKRRATTVIKPFALGSHKYPLAALHWTLFNPNQRQNFQIASPGASPNQPTVHFLSNRVVSSSATAQEPPQTELGSAQHFSLQKMTFSPPPAAMPAILCYLALRAKEEQVLPFLMGNGEAGTIPGLHNSVGGPDAFVAYPGDEAVGKQSERWDCQWYRCLSLGGGVDQVFRAGGNTALDAQGLLGSGTYRLGSIEGVWEGVFSYTEFTTYAAILAGSPPQTLQASLIAQHRQTWKLREHHLLADVPYSSDSSSSSEHHGKSSVDPFPKFSLKVNTSGKAQSGIAGNQDLKGVTSGGGLNPTPLPQGEALRAHLPPFPQLSFTETPEGLSFSLPQSYDPPLNGASPFVTESSSLSRGTGDLVTYHYHRYHQNSEKRRDNTGPEGGASYAARVKDIILTGEGHSSWGEFKLIGRIRPYDGFVYLAKQYTDGDRGQWLYRGYLVGAGGGAGYTPSSASSSAFSSTDGHLVGRWRDTLSPTNTHGYEGCFGMTRRH